MRVHLIAVPYDSGRRGERLGAGPVVLQPLLAERLGAAGYDVRPSTVEMPADVWGGEIRAAFVLAHGVAGAVREARAAGAFPLVLSGNCGPAAIGCVAGIGGAPAVCWFDAHGDFNTPETTVGGFLDGMALATLTGRCWRQLTRDIDGFQPVDEDQVALIGARDLDPLEAESIAASPLRRVAVTSWRTDLGPALASIAGSPDGTYLHLDLDVLDPFEGRINCYAAPGGFSRADAAEAIGRIAREADLAAAAITSFDPAADPSRRSLEAAVSLGADLIQAVLT